ncbi:hypothetical protein FQN54_003632 [Arachnomyces sp. PD_36]|nr:hypothetical protein FQN54_003632 [Arachnomyces sp. PD_36]
MDWGRRNYQQVDTLEPADIELVETSYGSSPSLNTDPTGDTTNPVKEDHASKVDSHTQQKSTWRVPAWRVGAVIAASGTCFTLMVNFAIAIAIPSTYGLENGISTLYTGSCGRTEKANTAIHLVVNLLSTLILSGSNYCMQCLSSPTRADIDEAHRNHQWLDIGVSSIRNIKAISTKKSVLWWALGLSSIPLHLLYNSVFFSAIATNSYEVFWVTEGFLEGAPFNKAIWDRNGEGTLMQERASTFDKLTNEECIRAYSQDFITTRKNVLLVVDTQGMPDAETEDSILNNEYYADGPLSPFVYEWICSNSSRCRPRIPSLLADIANGHAWTTAEYSIKYCLSEPYEESCTLHFSLSLTIVVIVCNVGKLAAMIATILWLHPSRPLITIGDAIDSFMTRNDAFTKGMCLASSENFRKNIYNRSPVPFERQKKKRGQAASTKRWRTVLFLFFLALAVVITLLGYGIIGIRGNKEVRPLWDLGFGAVHSSSMIKGIGLPSPRPSGIIGAVLLANTPQTILSFLYLLFNGLCTSMLLADEWGSYQLKRKTLRVSDPYGRQRSSYFLQLPYRYAFPLITMSAVLHWGVSQSLFLARVNVMDDDRDVAEILSTCGYSPYAIIFTLIMTCLLLFGGLALSYKKINSDMPIASSCSAAIAAACHTSSLDDCDNDPSVPLQWGVVSSQGQDVDDVGHCCFTAGQVTPLIEGRFYAGIRRRREDTGQSGKTSSNE